MPPSDIPTTARALGASARIAVATSAALDAGSYEPAPAPSE